MGFKFNPFTGNLDLVDTTAAAGSDTQVQFNSNGLLAGSTDFTWDDISDPKVLTVGGDINLDDGGSFQTTLQLVTPTAARTITFPDATGTVGLVAGSSGQLVFNNAGAYSGLSGVTTDGTDITLTGRFISSLNGAASAPPGTFTGTWFTGGTATTTKPQVLIEPTGTTSTAWSTSGTGLGVNAASGFGGRLLDLQTNGTSRAVVTGEGQFLIGTPAAAGNSLLIVQGFQGTATGEGVALLQRGSANPGTNTTLGRFRFSDNSSTSLGAEILAATDGNWASANYPGRLVFSTTANGASSPTERLRITNAGVLQIADAGSISVGTTTGTKIGTATTQKLGFYNATPVVQPAAVADATDAATVITQLNDLLAKLRTLGIIAT
jgi:hypothetical protein